MPGQIDFAALARQLMMHPQNAGQVIPFPTLQGEYANDQSLLSQPGVYEHPHQPPMTDAEKYLKALIEQQMRPK
jgi:hypothetical protein